MAKKGGVQQLQTEINTTEELFKFLEKDGLIILDVYTEWCGPCLAMVGSLKKVKLEQGGDDLQLAVVKCDNINVLERFHNKSEPTWLFASRGKLVNSAFGSNVPDLMALITKELDTERETQKDPTATNRIYYELTELTPIELVRYNAKLKIQQETEEIERNAAIRQRQEYLTFVTDRIMFKARDCGVTIFFPPIIARDLFKKLSDPADKFQLTARDKKTVQILQEHLEVMHFECDNPMPKYLIDHLLKKDVFMVCWKLTDTDGKTIQDVLADYVNLMAHSQPIKDEFGNVNPDVRVPPLIKSLSLMVEIEEDEEILNDTIGFDAAAEINLKEKEEHTGSEKGEQSEQVKEQEKKRAQTPPSNRETPDLKIRSGEATPKQIVAKTKINIPAAWTPSNKRAQAALIYLYFRHLTEIFLPPDPAPEKPHITMIFESYKRKELMDTIEQYPDHILAYGYFTSDDLATATLLANSTFAYQKTTPTIHDKMILKVSKVTSDTILSLSVLGPSYMSKNSEIGKAECLILFPPGYTVGSETGEPERMPEEEKPTKKKKKRKHKQGTEEVDNAIENGEQPPEQDESELGDEDDGDDHSDDEDGEGEKNEESPEIAP